MVDFAEHERSQSGVDARIGSEASVVQSVLEAVRSASVEETLDGAPDGDDSGPVTTPPLYDFVDPDALEALYAHARDHQETAAWTTTFRYADSVVSVTSAGTVTVEHEQAEASNQRVHGCPSCDDGAVDVSDDRFVVGATLQCPDCGNEWNVSF